MAEIKAFCAYCGSEYTSVAVEDESGPWRPWSERLANPRYRARRMTCSSACQKRNAVWTAWINKTRAQAVGGDVNKPARVSELGTSGLLEATAPYEVTNPDQLTFAA